MKHVLQRFIAILLLVVPGVLATYGFLLMKDALFIYFSEHGKTNSPSFDWLGMLIGAILFLIGVSFIAGWIFFRDRKRNYLSPRFNGKKKRPRS